MEAVFSQRFFLSAGEADPEKEMALPVLVTRLIDIATTHANSLGIGNPHMPRPSMGWVLSRLTIDMERYPALNSDYSISTWVESWNRHFSQRAFSICDSEGNTLGYARSIWMVLDTETRANAGLSELNFDLSLLSDKECPIPKQMKHESIGEGARIPALSSTPYRFKYCDLDSYRHVNTVRYVQLLLNQFGLADYDANRMRRLELSFLHEARYGMSVNLNRALIGDNGLDSAFYLEDSATRTPILYARSLFAPRM